MVLVDCTFRGRDGARAVWKLRTHFENARVCILADWGVLSNSLGDVTLDVDSKVFPWNACDAVRESCSRECFRGIPLMYFENVAFVSVSVGYFALLFSSWICQIKRFGINGLSAIFFFLKVIASLKSCRFENRAFLKKGDVKSRRKRP